MARRLDAWKIVNGFFEALYTERPTRAVVAAGYSWGGRYAVLLTHRSNWKMANGGFREGGFVVGAFAAHPAMLSVPKDLASVARPLSLALSDVDEMVGEKGVKKMQDALASVTAVETEIKIYEGAQDGEFASVRARNEANGHRICRPG